MSPISPSSLNLSLRSAHQPRSDRAFLSRVKRPNYELAGPTVRVVDLFAGCGGMTLGLAQGAFELGVSTEVLLAVDHEPHAISTLSANFPTHNALCQSVKDLFDGPLFSGHSASEQMVRAAMGHRPHFLLGGPPCQGHSDLNNHTRRTDRKNSLYATMARAAEVLNPLAVVIENVPTVLHDRRAVVQVTREALQALGYRTADGVVDLSRLGVPQARRRHLLLATKRPLRVASTYLIPLFKGRDQVRSLAWAIRDLEHTASELPIDQPSAQSSDNVKRATWLHENNQFDLPDKLRPPCHRNKRHSYKSVYGRLSWDKPAPTITSGFTSMGQGRFLHPSRRRTLTPHEAARIQFFPDFFDWGEGTRTSTATMIGNAVPPKLTMEIAHAIIPDLLRS